MMDSPSGQSSKSIIHKLCISVKCRNLLQLDIFSMLCPVVGLFEEDPLRPYHFRLVDQTEVIRDELNPNFEHEFVVEQKQDEVQQFSFRVYDACERSITEEDFLGSAVVNLKHLVDEHRPSEDSIYNLENYVSPELSEAFSKRQATIFLNYRPFAVSRDEKLKAELAFRCKNLPETKYGDADRMPVLALFEKNNGVWKHVGQTEQSKDMVNPHFSKKLVVDCNTDNTEEHKISIYDTNTKKVSEGNRVATVLFQMSKVASKKGKITKHKLELSKHAMNLEDGAESADSADSVVIVECTRKFEPYSDKQKRYIESVSQHEWEHREVYEGAHRVAMRDVVVKLENMITFGRGCVRHFVSEIREAQKIHLFYRKMDSFGESRVLHWCAEGQRDEAVARSINLGDVSAVILGKQTAAFQQKWAHKIPDKNCFSIVAGRKNILNLEMDHTRLRDVWVFAITKLLQETNQMPKIYQLGEYKLSKELVVEEENESLDSFNLLESPFSNNSPTATAKSSMAV